MAAMGTDPDLLSQLRQNAVFASAAAEDLARFGQLAEVVEVGAGDRILDEGDASGHVFVLLSGVVGVFYSSPDGVDVLVKIFGPPAVFGEMELFFGQPRQEYVECFEPARVARIPAAPFLAWLKRDPKASFALLQDVAARLAIAAYNERALAFLDANTRLAGLFLSFLEAWGEEGEGGVTLRLKLTYEMLARCLGVTVRSIDRAMTAWSKEGWLTRRRGTYTFHDVKKLEEKADPERLALFTHLGHRPAAGG
jgi:CRP-like cAMP-binding protein